MALQSGSTLTKEISSRLGLPVELPQTDYDYVLFTFSQNYVSQNHVPISLTYQFKDNHFQKRISSQFCGVFPDYTYYTRCLRKIMTVSKNILVPL